MIHALFWIAATLLCSQIHGDLLAVGKYPVSGQVLDSDGMPLAGVRIDHLNGVPFALQSDATGRFAGSGAGPYFIARKLGFQSIRFETKNSTDITLRMERHPEQTAMPTCSKSDGMVKSLGTGGVFRFPKKPGVRIGNTQTDSDYVTRTYFSPASPNSEKLLHGAGVVWTFGMPSNELVWRSIEYREKLSEVNGSIVIDAQGRFVDGKSWRYLGKISESIFYSGISDKSAKQFDAMLDQACVEARPKYAFDGVAAKYPVSIVDIWGWSIPKTLLLLGSPFLFATQRCLRVDSCSTPGRNTSGS